METLSARNGIKASGNGVLTAAIALRFTGNVVTASIDVDIVPEEVLGPLWATCTGGAGTAKGGLLDEPTSRLMAVDINVNGSIGNGVSSRRISKLRALGLIH